MLKGLATRLFCGTFSSSVAKRLDIRNVPSPSRCKFVPDQVFPRDDVRWYFAFDQTLNPVLPCFIEADAIDALQDVDPRRGPANLKSRTLLVIEIRGAESLQWCAESRESRKNSLAIFFIGADKNIQVFRRSWFGMDAHGVAANHKVFNPVCVERE